MTWVFRAAKVVAVVLLVALFTSPVRVVPHPNGDNNTPYNRLQNNTSPQHSISHSAASKSENVLETPCYKGEDNRQSDLCAQWKAADAADRAAFWAVISTIVGVIGTAAVLLTIKLNFRAVKAAEDAVLTSQSIGQATVRPYVSIITTFKTNSVTSGTRFYADVAIENTGSTPAFDCEVRCMFRVVETSDPHVEAPLMDTGYLSFSHLASHQKVEGTVQTERVGLDEFHGLVEAHTHLAQIVVSIRYRDTFDVWHDTRLRSAVAFVEEGDGFGWVSYGNSHFARPDIEHT